MSTVIVTGGGSQESESESEQGQQSEQLVETVAAAAERAVSEAADSTRILARVESLSTQLSQAETLQREILERQTRIEGEVTMLRELVTEEPESDEDAPENLIVAETVAVVVPEETAAAATEPAQRGLLHRLIFGK